LLVLNTHYVKLEQLLVLFLLFQAFKYEGYFLLKVMKDKIVLVFEYVFYRIVEIVNICIADVEKITLSQRTKPKHVWQIMIQKYRYLFDFALP